jgi:hypothetical protein
MLKKIITLSIVTAVLLIGVENSIAQEGTGNPEQGQRRRQGQEGRPGQRGREQHFRGRQEKDSESPAKGVVAEKKIEAMRKKRQQALESKGTPRNRDRMGRRSQQSRPGRNQPMQRMFGGRGRSFQGRGIGRRGQRYQCEGLCPCCQRGMSGMGRGFQGRGMMGRGGKGFQGRGGKGFQGRGMMGQGGPGYRGRGMMGHGGPGYQGKGMMDQGGQGFQGKGMMGGQGPDTLSPPEHPMQHRGMGRPDSNMPSPPESPMRGRGMGRPDSNIPSPPESPMRGRGMGRRGGGDSPRPGRQESKPDNN